MQTLQMGQFVMAKRYPRASILYFVFIWRDFNDNL